MNQVEACILRKKLTNYKLNANNIIPFIFNKNSFNQKQNSQNLLQVAV